MAIKTLALGFRDYLKGKAFNQVDAVIVLLSLIDIVISTLFLWDSHQISSGVGITIMRSFRLMRVFKLPRYWMRFELLLETLSKTLIGIRAFSVILVLFTYIYTIMGQDFFADKAKFDPNTNEIDIIAGVSPTFNFDTFINSFFTVFIVITNDGQSLIFYDYFRSVSSSLATFFWISLIILGQKVFLNLFLAFLLENFDEGILKERMFEIEKKEIDMGLPLQKRSMTFRVRHTMKTRW